MSRFWVLFLLVACDSAGVARIRFLLPDDLPDRTLFAVVRVEERAELETPGPILSGKGPVELSTEADRIAFEPLSVPHGDRRVVIAELREGRSLDSQVVHYGLSEPFSLAPGDQLEVPVAVTERPPVENRVSIVSPSPGFTRTATVELSLASDRGVRALVSNVPSFPEGASQEIALGGALAWDLELGIEPPCLESDDCDRTVHVRFIDARGYRSRTATAAIRLDTAAPSVAPGSLGLRLEPDPANPLREVGRARPGTKVQVSLSLSERLSEPLILLARSEEDEIPFDECTSVGLSWICTLEFPARPQLAERTYLIEGRARDLAGNIAAGIFAGMFVADTVAPPAPNVDCDGCIVYHRRPFGPPSFTVTSSPSAVEPGATVAILDGEDVASAEELGRSTPAAADGSFARITLTTADRPRVYALAIDAAGNTSARASLIRNVEATATFGPEPDNPSRVLLDPRFEAFARDRREGAYEEATLAQRAALAREDGDLLTSAAGYTWRDVTLRSSGPSPRENGTMIWDPVRDRAVLFGGLDESGQPVGDHWEWDGFNWSLRTAGPDHPEPRDEHCLIADLARSQLLLFGGYGTRVFDGTWLFDGELWRRHVQAGAPDGRYGHTIVYDPSREVVIMFGGINAGGEVLDETWIWDGEWRLLSPPASPTPRFHHGAAFDPLRERIVIFGGEDIFQHFDEVWEWNGTSWESPAPQVRPAARSNAGFVFHPELGAILMFSGGVMERQPVIFNDAFTWDGAEWAPFTIAGPAPRVDASLLLDQNRGRVLLFGGHTNAGPRSDIWEIDADGTSVNLTRIADPDPRSHAAMATDPVSGAPILFGGSAAVSANDDWESGLWRFEQNGWDPVQTSSAPPPLAWPIMATDDARSRAILVGYDESISTAETWAFDGASWSMLSSAPPARSESALAFDPNLPGMVAFGGRSPGAPAPRSDQHHLTDAWTQVSSSGPSARYLHRLATDPSRGTVLLFGGADESNQALSDLWSWNGAWTLQSQGGSRPRQDHAMVFDRGRDRLLVFGGLESTTTLAGLQSWDPRSNAWTDEPSSFGPRGRQGHSMQYDDRYRRTVLFGGCPEIGCGFAPPDGDTWLLERRGDDRPAIILATDLRSAVTERDTIRRVTLDVAAGGADLLVWHPGAARWHEVAGSEGSPGWVDGQLFLHTVVVGKSEEALLDYAEISIAYRLAN